MTLFYLSCNLLRLSGFADFAAALGGLSFRHYNTPHNVAQKILVQKKQKVDAFSPIGFLAFMTVE